MAIPYLDGAGSTRNAVGTHAGSVGDPDISLESISNKLPTALTASGNLKMAITENTTPATTSTVLQTAAVANGNGSTGSLDGYTTALFAVSGVTTATINFEVSNDGGTTWLPILATLVGGVTIAATATADGLYRISAAGLKLARARISGWSAGTITVTLFVTTATTSNKVITVAGGATAAKQPALGTAGTPSTDVSTVQGITGGTPQNVAASLPATAYHGQTNVTTAGTAVALAASQAITSGVTIKAKVGNTGNIFVGVTGVTSSTGYVLAPGDTVFLEVANLSTVFINSSVNGEGVSYLSS